MFQHLCRVSYSLQMTLYILSVHQEPGNRVASSPPKILTLTIIFNILWNSKCSLCDYSTSFYRKYLPYSLLKTYMLKKLKIIFRLSGWGHFQILFSYYSESGRLNQLFSETSKQQWQHKITTHTRICTHTRARTHAYARAHTHMHTRTHTHAYAHTRAHTHTLPQRNSLFLTLKMFFEPTKIFIQ